MEIHKEVLIREIKIDEIFKTLPFLHKNKNIK